MITPVINHMSVVTTSIDNCKDICDLNVYVHENAPVENLKWNLIDLLKQRVNTTNYFDQLQFSLSTTSKTTTATYFQLSSSILSYNHSQLDREEFCKLNLCSYEQYQCDLSLSIFTQTSFIVIFQLIIQDQNDIVPIFDQSNIDIVIRENLQPFYHYQLPTARDLDSNMYNIDKYSFVNNEFNHIFELIYSNNELNLKVLKTLDCEQRSSYQLKIIAQDKGGQKSNILSCNVTVGDFNEFQPKFQQHSYNKYINESFLVNDTVMIVSATDDDCYDKIIIYSLISDSIVALPFRINSKTGEIMLTRSVDYEQQTTYRFRIKAANQDGITNSIVPVTIQVLDVNDNEPRIYTNILANYKIINRKEIDNDNVESIIVDENISIGQVIGTILVKDDDSMKINKQLTISLLSCLPSTMICPLILDHDSMTIRIARVLDTEQDDMYKIVLQANDQGTPPLLSQRHLFLYIRHRPRFTQKKYYFYLSISSSPGSTIGHVEANSTESRLIEYTIVTATNFVDIDSTNGTIYLKEFIYIEYVLNLTVQATNTQNRALFDQTIILIHMYNQNNCSPLFDHLSYTFNVSEQHISPFEIGQVHAMDCTSNNKLSVTYTLIEADTLPFRINNNNGMLIVTHELDRETIDKYDFYVMATIENRTTSKTRIYVYVIDRNDHIPTFVDNYTERFIYVSSIELSTSSSSTSLIRRHNSDIDNSLASEFVTNVYAIDMDDGLNGKINYYFSNSDAYHHFHVYNNGSIYLYNRKHLNVPYRLEIYAKDNGQPALTSKNSILFYVCDINRKHECNEHYQDEKLITTFLLDEPSKTNYYLGSLFIMIAIICFVFIVISCTTYHVFLKVKHSTKMSQRTYNCRIEARKNLIVSDSLYDNTTTTNGQLKSVSV
ncbi:unnamed protein product [Didymodactylos carnosus]|uniref:Cadherin domain-containing protein n=1 Tax=Didymodactylos carnosus TaxID=1234261 RepID=A0A8S2HIA8_9BILA|nr:unnamed protein product [Didymodactylos carnosus]CAF3653426.1 unnamed protein product [Didymodactylos carnosus]